MKNFFVAVMLAVMSWLWSCETFYCMAPPGSDIVEVMEKDGYRVVPFTDLREVPVGSRVLLLNPGYPDSVLLLGAEFKQIVNDRKLRVFAEFAAPDTAVAELHTIQWERAVVCRHLCAELDSMDLLSVGNGVFCGAPSNAKVSVALAKVAGLWKAEYGLDGVPVYPMLYSKEGILYSTTRISDFAKMRFQSECKIKALWEYILSEISGENIVFRSWKSLVGPTRTKEDALPEDARAECVRRGIEWFYNGHFLVSPSWKAEWVDRYIGDGTMPVGPALPRDAKDGDGSCGVLEGHCSRFHPDGSQDYRYWLRADVQGETAMAFATAGRLLDRKEWYAVSDNLIDYTFREFRDGPRNDPSSPSYGLIGWASTHKHVYYGDDNARVILGMTLASAITGSDVHKDDIKRAIMANFNTAGIYGFRGSRVEERHLKERSKDFYSTYDLVAPHPHFESWLWACYLWLYRETGDSLLLQRSEKAIRLTMEAYPQKWSWTNGIQQERARMILPLAWLYRVSPTEEHLGWLMEMSEELLANQDSCGAIREELGDASKGMYGKIRSNMAYGTGEAPIIFQNGDPIADMLYTCNFAFFGLNEAAEATEDPALRKAVSKLSDFLVRIQVSSNYFKDIDGAWLRAFNYGNWDYWAQDADAGWGARSTLTGWIQSWIVTTQALMEMHTSFWDMTT